MFTGAITTINSYIPDATAFGTATIGLLIVFAVFKWARRAL